MVTERRVVVIGAGVIGSAIGLQLARRGWQVTILDRDRGVGMGSTAASSAVVRFTYSTHAGTAMAYESAEWWRNWADHVGLPSGSTLTRFVQHGMVMFDDPSGAALAALPMLREVGVTHEWWSLEVLRARLPHLATGSWFPPTTIGDRRFGEAPAGQLGGALFTPEAGYITDPQLAAQNLADAAIAAGATLRTRSEVVAVGQQDGRVTGVRLSDGSAVHAPVVVNAAGPHSSVINHLAGVVHDMNVGTRPLRQQVAHVVVPPAAGVPVDAHPVTADIDSGIYFRPDHEALLVGGVEAECDPLVWLDDPDDVDLAVGADEWETHAYRLARRIPTVGVPHQRGGVVGVYDVSDDWMPILDRSSLGGFYMAIGSSGNQFKNAPVIGHCMAELVDAVEAGHDHDTDPLVVRGVHRPVRIDLGTFSRLRSATDEQRSRGVLG